MYSFADKDLVVLVDNKLTMSQQYALAAKNASHIRQTIASGSKEAVLPLYSAQMRHTWVMCPVLGCLVQNRHGYTGVTPPENHKDDELTGMSVTWREAESVHHREEKAQGDIPQVYKYLGDCVKEKEPNFSEVSSDKTRGN